MKRTYITAIATAWIFTSSISAAEPKDPWEEQLFANQERMFGDDERILIRQAEEAERAGKIDEAIQHYDHAAQLRGSVDTGVELGLAYLRAKRYLEAARELGFIQYFANPKVRHPCVVKAALEEARKHVGALKIHVNVEGATLHVDGSDITDWPFHHLVFVEPDKEVIVKVTKEGYWMSQTRVKVAAGEEREMLIGMHAQIRTPAGVLPNFNRGKPVQQSTWPVTVMLVSGGVMGLGVGALAIGLVQRGDAKTEDDQSKWTTVATVGGAISAVSLAGLIIGAAGIAARPAPAPVVISPSATQEGGGITVHGKW